MLTFLLQDDPFDDSRSVAGPPLPATDRDMWIFGRRTGPSPVHPATGWAVCLLQGAASISLACPRCRRDDSVASNLDHLLRHHQAGYVEAAAWLEAADADLFSLAVHYLVSKARSGPRPESHRQ